MSILMRRVTIPLLLLATAGSAAAGAARQDALPQREVDALIRDVLFDLFTVNDFARRAHVNDLTAKHYNVRADLLPLDVRLTAAALPNISGVEFTLIAYEDATRLAERTGQPVSFIDVGLLTFTPTEAAVRLGTDYAAPIEPGIIKLCCCSRIAYYTKQKDRWIFRVWGTRQCA